MTNRENQHRLDRLALQYLAAVETEDFETIDALWRQATEDADLDAMLHGLNAELVAEQDAQEQAVISVIRRGQRDEQKYGGRTLLNDIEEGRALAPKFDADGLITCVATDVTSGDVLMIAHMNAEALRHTIETGEAWYFSRSRQRLWRKGESSGHVQHVRELRVDCDQDAVWIKVEQAGPGACHTGRRSCFYRAVPLGQGADASVTLEFRDAERSFDPGEVYGGDAPKSGGQKTDEPKTDK